MIRLTITLTRRIRFVANISIWPRSIAISTRLFARFFESDLRGRSRSNSIISFRAMGHPTWLIYKIKSSREAKKKKKKETSFNSRLLLARAAVDLPPPVFVHPRKWHLFPNFASLLPLFNYVFHRGKGGKFRSIARNFPRKLNGNSARVNVDYDSLERFHIDVVRMLGMFIASMMASVTCVDECLEAGYSGME